MSDDATKDAKHSAVAEVMAKVDALSGKLSDAQRAQVAEIAEEYAKKFAAERKTSFGEPDTDRVLEGTKYGRQGMTEGQVQLLHAYTAGARAIGKGSGPSEQLTNIVNAIHERDVQTYGRAMDTAETGYGLQMIGVGYAGNLWEQAMVQSRVMSQIDSYQMTGNTDKLPIMGAPAEPIYAVESTANNSSNYTTVKTGSNVVTVTPKKLLLHEMWSGELEEDSIIPLVPFLEKAAAFSLAHFGDSLILNGDDTTAGTGNINSDDTAPTATKHYMAFDGIRHAAIVDATGQGVSIGGAITFDDIARRAKALLIDGTYFIDWGNPLNSNDLIYVAEPKTALRIAMLDEVIKAREASPGLPSQMLQGEVSRVLGHPLISSVALTTQDTDGKYTTTSASTNSIYGQVVVFNRNSYVVGWKRQVKVELERLPATDQTRIVYSWRLGLGRYSSTGAASGIKGTAVLYNIAVA